MKPHTQTPAQMRRKIERLENKVKVLEEKATRAWSMFATNFQESSEYSMRIQQALKILQGEDDEN